MNSDGGERVLRWERRTGRWLVLLAVVFLAAYAVPILWPELPEGWRFACHAADWLIWALFGADYLVRVAWADDRWQFVRSHPFDLAVLVLPMLRPLRLLRLVKVLMEIERRTDVWTRGKVGVYVAATTALLVFVASLAILDAERDAADGNISTFGDALWWSLVTVTTVGYGDHFPTTGTGRAVALAMMLCGIGLLGFVTGSLASWVMERLSAMRQTSEETQEDVAEVLAELRALRAEVAAWRLREADPDGSPAPPPTQPDPPRPEDRS